MMLEQKHPQEYSKVWCWGFLVEERSPKKYKIVGGKKVFFLKKKKLPQDPVFLFPPRKGCDYVDISLVDGWTLPVKLDIKGDCTLGEKEWTR